VSADRRAIRPMFGKFPAKRTHLFFWVFGQMGCRLCIRAPTRKTSDFRIYLVSKKADLCCKLKGREVHFSTRLQAHQRLASAWGSVDSPRRFTHSFDRFTLG